MAALAAGHPPAGTMLPKEQALAAEYGFSRGVARELIRALEERGVVRVTHGRGATVQPQRQWNVLDRDVLGALSATRRAGDVVEELLECRRLVEVPAAALAADRATSDDLDEMERALSAMDSPAGTSRRRAEPAPIVRAQLAFHHALAHATQNRPLARFVHVLLDGGAERPGFMARGRIAVDEHRRILAAVRARDRDAAAGAMRDHLDRLTVRTRHRRDGAD